jgi:hypothetical protein
MHRIAVTCLTALLLAACSGASSTVHSGSTSTTAPTLSSTSTSPPSTSPPATEPSSTCTLISNDQVTTLLQSGPLTEENAPMGCSWFASDANRNATLSVNDFGRVADATTTFKSEQLFTPGVQSFAFGDRAYTSALPQDPRHAAAKILLGSIIVTAVVNGPILPADAIAAARTMAETATAQVRKGVRP